MHYLVQNCKSENKKKLRDTEMSIEKGEKPTKLVKGGSTSIAFHGFYATRYYLVVYVRTLKQSDQNE